MYHDVDDVNDDVNVNVADDAADDDDDDDDDDDYVSWFCRASGLIPWLIPSQPRM